MTDKQPADWFTSNENSEYMTEVVEAERMKMAAILEEKGLLYAMSHSLAALSFHSSSLKALGLKETAIQVLKDALKQAREG